MNESTSSPPGWNPAPRDPSRIVLSGAWTLEHAKAVAECLRTMPRDITILDANRIERVDSAGVAQLIRHAHRQGLDDEHLLFRDEHQPLAQLQHDDHGEGVVRRRAQLQLEPQVDDRCRTTLGRWRSLYDGATTDDPADLQVDHVVPLADAWRSGAAGWTPERRLAFANDLTSPDALLAVDEEMRTMTFAEFAVEAERSAAGLARTGSDYGHGSGDVALAFSTAYRLPQRADQPMPSVTLLHESALDLFFQAAAEATEQAIVHALWAAVPLTGRDGHHRHALTAVAPELLTHAPWALLHPKD